MEPFLSVTGRVAALPRANVDTDQIIPKQFLKRIERTGFGACLFYDWRYLEGGVPNPDFELNQPVAQGATILLAGSNFGCGSSREHAPWALGEYGFRSIIAPSFADIFFGNCCQTGILPVVLPERDMEELFRRAGEPEGYSLTVDLGAQRVSDDRGFSSRFSIDGYRRGMLMQGLDEIGRTLLLDDLITAFEQRQDLPYSPRSA
jgi:3-isopropylmalate/(R)-2-methylmalate dehydratase small subunit